MTKRILVAVGLLLLVSFALLSKYEDRTALRNLDFAVTVKVQERIDRSTHLRLADFVGNVMEGATYFAAPLFTSIAVLMLTGLVIYDKKRKRIRWKSMLIPIGFLLILMAELFGKSIVHHPSPPFGMIKHPTSVFPANYVNEQFSYPSGHAARAVYIAIAAVYYIWAVLSGKNTTRKRAYILVSGAIAVTYVVLVSVSRIYLGEHWFTDVIGGLFLGSSLGVLTWVSMATYNRKTMSD